MTGVRVAPHRDGGSIGIVAAVRLLVGLRVTVQPVTSRGPNAAVALDGHERAAAVVSAEDSAS